MEPRTTRDKSMAMRWPIAAFAFACLSGLLAAPECMAQRTGNDYYAPRVTPDERQLLVNVEQYHLGPAQEKRGTPAFGTAIGDIEFILKYYPNHPQALDLYSQLCTSKYRQPSCDTARVFEDAIAVNPNAASTYVVKGIDLQRVGKPAAAAEQYEAALRLDPQSRNAHYNLALALFDMKQFDASNAHAQAAYAAGITLPGLRNKLTSAGQWRPLSAGELAKALGTDAAAGGGAVANPAAK